MQGCIVGQRRFSTCWQTFRSIIILVNAPCLSKLSIFQHLILFLLLFLDFRASLAGYLVFPSTSFSFKFPCSKHSELKPQGEELTGWATAASRRWNPTALSNPDKAHFVGHKQLSIHTYTKTIVILKVSPKLMFGYGVSTTLIRKLGKLKSRKLIVIRLFDVVPRGQHPRLRHEKQHG